MLNMSKLPIKLTECCAIHNKKNNTICIECATVYVTSIRWRRNRNITTARWSSYSLPNEPFGNDPLVKLFFFYFTQKHTLHRHFSNKHTKKNTSHSVRCCIAIECVILQHPQNTHGQITQSNFKWWFCAIHWSNRYVIIAPVGDCVVILVFCYCWSCGGKMKALLKLILNHLRLLI